MPTKHGVDECGGKSEVLLSVLCLKKAAFLFTFLNYYISLSTKNTDFVNYVKRKEHHLRTLHVL